MHHTQCKSYSPFMFLEGVFLFQRVRQHMKHMESHPTHPCSFYVALAQVEKVPEHNIIICIPPKGLVKSLIEHMPLTKNYDISSIVETSDNYILYYVQSYLGEFFINFQSSSEV
jgi:hypothetical protein